MHEGHRSRLREKFLRDMKSLADHELIELLLFYSQPRKNTNETAHELMRAFGSLRGVLDAETDNLADIFGVGKSAAVLIKVCAELNLRYNLSQDSRLCLDSFSALSDYLKKLFIGIGKETSFVLVFNNSFKLIATEILNEGAVNSNEITTYKLSKICGKTDAASIVLAHNHPGGTAVPSKDDIYATHILAKFCSQIKVRLIDHFVVAGDVCRPILNEAFTLPTNLKEKPKC